MIQKPKQLLVLASLIMMLVAGLALTSVVSVQAKQATCKSSSAKFNKGICASCYQDEKNCVDCSKGACSDEAATCKAGGAGKNRCDLIAKYVQPAVNLFSAIVGLVIAISLIAGGVLYASSAGDPQKAAAAKSRISKSVIAFFIYAFFFAFLQFLLPGGAFK